MKGYPGFNGSFMRPPSLHICGLFDTEAQRRAAVHGFFRAGLMAGERCVVVVDSADPTDSIAAIGSESETTQWREAGVLEIRTPQDDQPSANLTLDEMLDVWGGIVEMARQSPARIGGDVAWWLHQTSRETLLRYEAELNRSMPTGLSALCLYDLRRFDPAGLLEAVRTHPKMLIGDRFLVDNRYYADGDELPHNRSVRFDLPALHNFDKQALEMLSGH